MTQAPVHPRHKDEAATYTALPGDVSRHPLIAEKLEKRTEKSGDGCWIWTACRSILGYGHFEIDGKTKKAHRLWYELVNGPIPEGLGLDHLCRNPPCVNPAHMEPVSQRVNVQRGQAGLHMRLKAAGQTHCKNGHPYTPENTYRAPSTGRRQCKICANTTRRKSRAKFVKSADPVAWMPVGPDGKKYRPSFVQSGYAAHGWTETPLYATPQPAAVDGLATPPPASADAMGEVDYAALPLIVPVGGKTMTLGQLIDGYLEATAALSAMSPAWQDIATAPRDGIVLVYFNDGTIDTATWNNGIWASVRRSVDAVGTHWMPLPSFPQAIREPKP